MVNRRNVLIGTGILTLFVLLIVMGAIQSIPVEETTALPTLAVLPDVAVDSAAVDSAPSILVGESLSNDSIDSSSYLSSNFTQPITLETDSEAIPQQVVIRFAPDTTSDEKRAYLNSVDAQVTQHLDVLNAVVVQVEEADQLPDSKIVEEAEPDYVISALYSVPPNDVYYNQQWGLSRVGAPQAWAELDTSSPMITVAVIDSGICAEHPDLAGRIRAGYDYIDDDTKPQDMFGHGCAVSGIIAANMDDEIGIAGVAPNAQIMPLRVLDENGLGAYSDVAAAIIYATDNGADIINLSVGGTNASSVLENAVQYAADHDVLLVGAAGNNSADLPLYPARYNEVIAVGSIDADGSDSAFSNRGVDVKAPGSSIYTLAAPDGYHTVSGTSFAAPFVSGVAALDMARGYEIDLSGAALAQVTQTETTSDEISALAVGDTLRVSEAHGGGDADGMSYGSSISVDGRYVVFISDTTNLVASDTNNYMDAVVFDRQTSSNELVSVATNGDQSDTGADQVIISPNGRYAAFVSRATNLGGPGTGPALFIRDLLNNTTTYIAYDISAMGPGEIAFSPEGRYLAYKEVVGIGDKLYLYDQFTGTHTPVSVDRDGNHVGVDRFSVSANGRYVVFNSSANNIVANDTNNNYDSFRRDMQTGTTELVSVNTSGQPAGGSNELTSISWDGRYVAFSNSSENLVASDANGTEMDVFLRDMQTGTTSLVSVSSSGVQANQFSGEPSISANGRYIAFRSDGSNLVTGDTNNHSDVFVRDLQAGTTTRVSVNSSGEQATGGFVGSSGPALSADGRFVTFSSHATNLVANDLNDMMDVFLREWTATADTLPLVASFAPDQAYGLIDTPIQFESLSLGDISSYSWDFGDGGSSTLANPTHTYSAHGSYTVSLTVTGPAGSDTYSQTIWVHNEVIETRLVSSNASDVQGNSMSTNGTLSANKRYVAFASEASNLVPDDTNTAWDIFVKDLETGAIERVSLTSTGDQFNMGSSSGSPVISADGRYVAFVSNASNLGVSSDAYFLRDIDNGTTTYIDDADDVNWMMDLAMSADGRYIAYITDNGSVGYAALYDRQTGTSVPVSVDQSDTIVSADEVDISADGRYVVFNSHNGNIVPNDTNNQSDVFMRDMQTGTVSRVSVASNGSQGMGYASNPAISWDGRYVAFGTDNAFDPADTGGNTDVYLHDTVAGTTTRVSVHTDGTQGKGTSYYPAVSADGRYVAFKSDADNLVDDDANALTDAFIRDTVAGTTTRVSVHTDLSEGISSMMPMGVQSLYLSPDGSLIVFGSEMDNLVDDDTNNMSDIFMRQWTDSGDPHPTLASFIYAPTSITNGSPVQFTSLSVSDITSYSWDFGDGGSSTQANPSHTYTWGGEYTVKLTVTGSNGSDTYQVTLNVAGDPPPSSIELVSRDYNGDPVNVIDEFPGLSTDGQAFAFHTTQIVVPEDDNGVRDCHWRDLETDELRRLTLPNGITECGIGASSLDERYVIVDSSANGVVPEDQNGESDLFRYDLQTDAIEAVNISEGGVYGNGLSRGGVLSADGRYIAFVSTANNLVADDTNNLMDVFVRDMDTGVIERVSVDSNGGQMDNGSGVSSPSISADGRFVVFSTRASNLVDGDSNNAEDVFLHDRATGETTRVSVSTSGTQGNYDAQYPAISADGRFIAFWSKATNIISGDTNAIADVFVHDRISGETTRVSLKDDGSQITDKGPYSNIVPQPLSISAHGRFVGFRTISDFIVADDDNDKYDAFVRDRQNETTIMLSLDSTGAAKPYHSYRPFISANGRYAIFMSDAGLTPDGTESDWQLYRYDLGAAATTDPIAVFRCDPCMTKPGQAVEFTSLSWGNITTHEWDFDGDGTTDSTSDVPVSFSYPDEGTYTVKLTLNGTRTVQQDVVVAWDPPVADFEFAPATGIMNIPVDFSNLSTGDIAGYEWDFGDGTGTSTDENPSYAFADTGTYTVTLSATGLDTTVDTIQKQITIGGMELFCDTVSGIPSEECHSLLNLYGATNGATWTDNTNWMKTNTPCNWYGVTCAFGHVKEIDLQNNNLTGTLPDSLSSLTHLEKLLLNGNAITGEIPAEFGSLSSLNYLYLYDNQLTGSIPPELGNLANLAYLDLEMNQLSGSIPPELGDLSMLMFLGLYENQLSGTIPPELGDLANLQKLYLQKNQLVGEVPASFTQLTNLLNTYTDLSYNGLWAAGDTAAFITSKDADWADTQTIAPQNLIVQSAQPDQITLSWDAITFQANGNYQVSLLSGRNNSTEAVQGSTTSKTDTSFTVSGLRGSTEYQFCVRSYSPASGDQQNSILSPCATITAVTAMPDANPLTLVEAHRSSAALTWAMNLVPIDQHYLDIERSPDGANWQQVVRLMANQTSFTDDTLSCGQSYQYRARLYRKLDNTGTAYTASLPVSTDACPSADENIVGLYKEGIWQFRDSNKTGGASISFEFGPQQSGWQPLVGDWDGDDIDGIGLYKEGMFILRQQHDEGSWDYAFIFGPNESGWQPIVGDWNGDDVDSIGLYKEGMFLLSDSNTEVGADYAFVFGEGMSGYIPIAGDWNGSGTDTIGLYKEGMFHLSNSLRDQTLPRGFQFGPTQSGWGPLVGDWNEDGIASIGVYQLGIWRLRNTNSTGAPDNGFNFGPSNEDGWIPIASYRGGVSGLMALSMPMEQETAFEIEATEELEVTVTPDAGYTAEPTIEPEITVEPTIEPTLQVTATHEVITPEPTLEPTEITAEPTLEPTMEPTVELTEVTPEPTIEPTVVTPEPTLQPTAEPTEAPQEEPETETEVTEE